MEDGSMEGVKGEFRGRCEKTDLQMWSEFGAKKSRSRMLLNLDLGPSARTPGLKSETWATRLKGALGLPARPPSCGLPLVSCGKPGQDGNDTNGNAPGQLW
jgi:hypothetical protein